MKKIIVVLLMLTSVTLNAAPWPIQPQSPSDPGSKQYLYESFHETLSVKGRKVDFYVPKDFQKLNKKLTVVVFGHGQAIPLSSYHDTFEHLARKGVAVVYPEFDTGFFDQNWRRMAADYVDLTNEVIKKYPNSLDSNKVIFAGHSKGGYVAGVAAGLPLSKLIITPAAVILFNPAGYDAEYIKQINPRIPVTLTWSDRDTIIKKSLVQQIYDSLPSQRKQFIQVTSYKGVNPDLSADHFFVLTKSFAFGGKDGITPFHYYGSWKWILGAVWDLESGSNITNTFVYGDQTLTTGNESQHQIQKNW